MDGVLFLIRHGESLANAGLPTADPTSIPLTPRGHEQAEAIAANLVIKPDLIASSPFVRARQTSVPLRKLHPDVQTETWAVQEYIFFNLQGAPATTGAERKPLVEAFWQRCDPFEKQPNAESFAEFWNRVVIFSQQVEQFSGRHLVVFTHGFFMRAFEYGRRHGFGPCSSELMRTVYTWLPPDPYPNGCVLEYPLIESPVLEMGNCVDIASGAAYPGGALSNFLERTFVFDGVICKSAEGLLQSLKFGDVVQQETICKLEGREAKAVGATRNEIWQSTQTLWWKGRPMSRQGKDYQTFLDTVYQTVADQCEDFRDALLATGVGDLTHSIGSSDPAITVLTSQEFCSRLLRLRQALRDRSSNASCFSTQRINAMEPSESLKQAATEAISEGLSSFQYGGVYHIASTLPKGQVSTFFVLGEYVVYSVKDNQSD